jgi:hypothetical protein
MFRNLGIHVIEFPSKRFGYVGSLPPALGEMVPATTADIMGGRAYTHPTTGDVLTIKFPSFETRSEAIAHAIAHGFTVR